MTARGMTARQINAMVLAAELRGRRLYLINYDTSQILMRVSRAAIRKGVLSVTAGSAWFPVRAVHAFRDSTKG